MNEPTVEQLRIVFLLLKQKIPKEYWNFIYYTSLPIKERIELWYKIGCKGKDPRGLCLGPRYYYNTKFQKWVYYTYSNIPFYNNNQFNGIKPLRINIKTVKYSRCFIHHETIISFNGICSKCGNKKNVIGN